VVLVSEIITRFRLSRTLQSDNGPSFKDLLLKEFLRPWKFNIIYPVNVIFNQGGKG
jgi:hypothetical protein